MFHIGPAAVRYLAATHDDFPAPVTVVRVRGCDVRIWLRAEVEAWGAPRGYLGRDAAAAAPAGEQLEPVEPAGPRYAVPPRKCRRYALRASG